MHGAAAVEQLLCPHLQLLPQQKKLLLLLLFGTP
jgi:hypothetical protein